MDKLIELKNKKAELVKEAKEILDSAEDNLTEEQEEKYDSIKASIEKTTKQIERMEEVRELEKTAQPVKTIEPEAVAEEVKAEPQPKTKPFKNIGEQVQAIYEAGKPGGSVSPKLLEVQAAASGQNEAINSEGGFLLQDDFVSGLIKDAFEQGNILSRVQRRTLTTGANSITLKRVKQNAKTAAGRFGGIQAYWEAEAAQATSSTMEFEKHRLEVNKLFGLAYVTEELLADAPFLSQEINQAFADAVEFMVEDSIINGTGAGKPLGILNGDALVSVSKETGQSASTIVAKNVQNMWARMHAPARRNAVWLINQDIEPQLMNMTISVGTGGVAAYLPPNGLSDSPFGTLLGRPVVPNDYCATLGTVGDIIFVDLNQYLLVDKGAPNQAASMHLRFDYDETAFRITYRVDGQPTRNSAITPNKGSNTLSPYVALATRS